MKLLPCSLATTLLLGALAGHAADAPSSEPRTDVRKAMKVMVVDDANVAVAGAPGRSIVVTARSVDGEKPALKIQVQGDDPAGAEAFELPELAPGETKTFTTSDGRAVEVTRTDEGLRLSVDGKEIVLPQILEATAPDGAGLPGFAHVETFVTTSGEGDADGAKDVIVMHAPPAMVMLREPDVDHLESLKGLDPEVREKVIAALHEILSQPPGAMTSGFAYSVPPPDAPAPAGAPHRVEVRRVRQAPAPGPHVE